MTRCGKCQREYTGARTEHCTVCHETFTSTVPGDMHRTGAHGTPERRCRTTEEMLAKGMTFNPRGVWNSGKGQYRPNPLNSAPELDVQAMSGTPGLGGTG